MAEARKWLHQIEVQKAEAKEKKVVFKNEGIRLVDVADEFLELKRKQAKKGKIKDSYVEQLRIQTDHFKRFFNGERTTFVKTIQTAQIEAYFEFEEKQGISRKSIEKYKTHLKQIWAYMLKDINWETKRVTIFHNRVQLVTKDTVKLPKREKVREIELHNAGYTTLKIYKEWQEAILGRPVAPEAFALQWEINLLQDYVCHTGKVSRKWKEIYNNLNKLRVKAKKKELPYGRIHDGRHTYITLLLHGIEKDDKSIISPASFFQVYESAGHSLPRAMQNVSNTVYIEDKGDRWDITRFWNEDIYTDIAECWRFACEVRQIEADMMTELEKATKQAQKQQRLEKAKTERLKGNPPEDILIEYK